MTKASLKTQIELAVRKTESQELLELVYSLLQGTDAEMGKRISRKQYNIELKSAILEGKEGKYKAHGDLEKETR